MNSKQFLKLLYILSALSLFLPWFSYNPDVMGYCRGINFLGWFLLPMLVIGAALFGRRSPLGVLLTELSLAANLAVLAVAFGRWQEVFNIQAGFRWCEGFEAARMGYWISLGLFVTMFSWFQLDLLAANSKKRNSRVNTKARGVYPAAAASTGIHRHKNNTQP